MDEVANIVLKHDGVIWGPYVWSMLNGTSTNKMKVRFIDKNIFNFGPVFELSKQFMVDLNEKFKIYSFTNEHILLGNGLEIEISMHSPVKEMEFISKTDYTCNLVDYTRSGFFLRSIPAKLSFHSSPYQEVISHIKSKELVPVHCIQSILNFADYPGWTFKKSIMSVDICKYNGNDQCSICQAQMTHKNTCVKLDCSHTFHLSCMCKWVAKGTCPLCRKQI
jgi:hypothetical protein